MPALGRLFSEGRTGVLSSTLPWYTIPGWASLNSGVAPARHGLLHWVKADPSEYFENRRRGRRFVNSSDLSFPAFWDIAGAAGKRVAVVNMPMTFPAWPVNGSMITGFLTPDGATEGMTYPPDLLSAHPGYRIEPASSLSGDMGETKGVDVPAFLGEMVQITAQRAEVASTLISPADVDLGVVVFVGPDRIAHKAWPGLAALVAGDRSDGAALPTSRAIRDYFVELDRGIDRLVKAAGPDTTVMIVSDHGFGPPPAGTFAVNAWLREAGYLKVRAPRVQQTIARRKALRRAVGAVGKRIRKKRAGEYAGVDWSQSSMYGVRFPRTRMFGLVVNRAGTKREGWVGEAEAAALCRRAGRELLSLTADDGERVVRSVVSREELGATAPAFPDMLVETREGFDPIDGIRNASLFGRFDEPSGMHEREGVMAIAGPAVREGGAVKADILDVAPTVLGLLGIRAPGHFEGTLREDLVRIPDLLDPPAADSISTASGHHGAPIGKEQESEIEAHLESLGYLD